MMRFLTLFVAHASCLVAAKGLNILLTSDDGFGSANIRELYKQLTSMGHECYIVASPAAGVKVGVQTEFTNSPTLAVDGDWGTFLSLSHPSEINTNHWDSNHFTGLVKAGAPSIGPDPKDNHIWYYNGTPIAQVLVGLDYIFPMFANIAAPDLVVYGPNSHQNIGGFPFTAAGAMGPTYVAVQRDIPAMAFWSENTPVVPYSWVNTTTEAGLQDPATLRAKLASSLIQAFIDKAAGSRILPKGYGVAVNLPFITSYTSDECVDPPFYLVPKSSDKSVKVAYDTKTGLVTQVQLGLEDAAGNVGFVGAAAGVSAACVSSVMVFAVNYDAPYAKECFSVPDVTAIIPVIVHSNGSTVVVGGRGPPPNVTAPGNYSDPPTSTPIAGVPPLESAMAGMGVELHCLFAALMVGFGMVVLCM
ncbi:hypothetical protein VTK26DRAFT_1940 [Humicola hyalothermophila]